MTKVEHTVTRISDSFAAGTQLQGYVTTSYAKLVRRFGTTALTAHDKIRAQWTLRIDGHVVTIYDYSESTPLSRKITWHVGGCTPEVVAYVASVLGVKAEYPSWKK